MLDRADEKIAKIFKSLVELPSLPAAVEKILKLSDKDTTHRQFADIIATDQGLTAKVLRIANSAFYSLRTPISSLSQASSLLGVKTLKSLAVSVSVMHLFNRVCQGFDPVSFWKHSISVAVASQKLGELLLRGHEDDLYIAGLLHDAGVALMVQYLPADYQKLLRLARSGTRPLRDVETEFLGITHAEIGYTLVTRWRFPTVICECIRHHESGDGAQKASSPESAKAVDLVRLADQYSMHLGLDFLPSTEAQGAPVPVLPAWVTLPSEELEVALKNLPQEVSLREQSLTVEKEATLA